MSTTPTPIRAAVYWGDRAAFRDDVTLINTLLAHGALADARADDGKTALAIAVERGHAHVARRLRGELP